MQNGKGYSTQHGVSNTSRAAVGLRDLLCTCASTVFATNVASSSSADATQNGLSFAPLSENAHIVGMKARKQGVCHWKIHNDAQTMKGIAENVGLVTESYPDDAVTALTHLSPTEEEVIPETFSNPVLRDMRGSGPDGEASTVGRDEVIADITAISDAKLGASDVGFQSDALTKSKFNSANGGDGDAAAPIADVRQESKSPIFWMKERLFDVTDADLESEESSAEGEANAMDIRKGVVKLETSQKTPKSTAAGTIDVEDTVSNKGSRGDEGSSDNGGRSDAEQNFDDEYTVSDGSESCSSLPTSSELMDRRGLRSRVFRAQPDLDAPCSQMTYSFGNHNERRSGAPQSHSRDSNNDERLSTVKRDFYRALLGRNSLGIQRLFSSSEDAQSAKRPIKVHEPPLVSKLVFQVYMVLLLISFCSLAAILWHRAQALERRALARKQARRRRRRELGGVVFSRLLDVSSDSSSDDDESLNETLCL